MGAWPHLPKGSSRRARAGTRRCRRWAPPRRRRYGRLYQSALRNSNRGL